MSTTLDPACGKCGGFFSFMEDRVVHKPGCPNAPIPLRPTPVSSLDAARFNRATHPAHLDPRTALLAALEWFDAQETKPLHIQILMGRDVGDECCSWTKFLQAGSYRHHAQMGLCLEAMNLIRESGT